MAKSVNNVVLDPALDFLMDNTIKLHVCSAEPTTYTEANATYMLANSAVLDFAAVAPADGVVSGRRVSVPEVVIASITNSGTATHIALSNGVDTLYYVTECTSQVLTATNPLTVPTWDVEIRDPA